MDSRSSAKEGDQKSRSVRINHFQQEKSMMKYFRNEFGPNKKCILMTGGIGLLIGLIVCGIPLAVLTTLYLQSSEF